MQWRGEDFWGWSRASSLVYSTTLSSTLSNALSTALSTAKGWRQDSGDICKKSTAESNGAQARHASTIRCSHLWWSVGHCANACDGNPSFRGENPSHSECGRDWIFSGAGLEILSVGRDSACYHGSVCCGLGSVRWGQWKLKGRVSNLQR